MNRTGGLHEPPSADPASAVAFQLGPFRLGGSPDVLLLDGQPVALGARGAAVLRVLVSAAPEFVAKDRIVDAAWPGLVVEESNLSVQISAVRRALATVPGAEDWLQTLPRRGYRYVGPRAACADDGPAAQGAGSPTAAAAPAAAVAPTNLTEPITSFIGRRVEVAETNQRLDESRLLTLLGAGGVGKTRLALRAAQDRLALHADGVWLVELAPLTSAGQVPLAVAAVLGVKEQLGRDLLETLAEHLRLRHVLLLLDNAEHLVAPCAALVEPLLRRCPDLRVLVTSRERLAVDGESVLRVPSLPLPDEAASLPEVLRSDAAQLFIQRARLQLPGFDVAPGDAATLASLCRRLDGIPLALELAAARIRSMPLDELVQRLDQRFRVLTGGSRTAPRRQQTLRALIDWSHDLLGPAEQALLARTTVFAGGWTLEAAEAVCSDDDIERWEVLDLFTSLADKSLLTTDVRLGATRYGLLDSVRHYAAERLPDAERARWARRHLDHFAQLGDPPARPRKAEEHAAWMDRLEAEHDNLHAALLASVTLGDDAVHRAMTLAGGALELWSRRGHFSEGCSLFGQLLATAPDQPTLARARTLRGVGELRFRQGELAGARQHFDASLAMCRTLADRAGMATALRHVGITAARLGTYAPALEQFDESLQLARDLGDEVEQALTLHEMGSIHMLQGQLASAGPLYEQTVSIMRRLGHEHELARMLLNLGILRAFEQRNELARGLMEEGQQLFKRLRNPAGETVALRLLGSLTIITGDLDASHLHSEQALTLARRIGDRNSESIGLVLLGDVARRRGQFESSQDLTRQGLRILAELGHRRMLNDVVDHMGFLCVERGDAAGAVALWGWAQGQREAVGAARQPSERDEFEAYVARARALLADEATYDHHWQRLQHLGTTDLVALAMAGQPAST